MFVFPPTDNPIPAPRTKKTEKEKPIPAPRTIIKQTNSALKGGSESYGITIKDNKNPLIQIQNILKNNTTFLSFEDMFQHP